MTARDTRYLLGALAVAGAAMVAGLGLGRAPAPVPGPPAHDGVVIRGFHSTRVVAGRRVIDVAADELRLERTRVGPFRLGFARALTARNARIEVRDGAGHAARPGGAGGATKGSAPARTVSSLRVDGLRLRVRGRTGDARLTLRATRCRADAWTGGTVVCHGLRVRGDGLDHRFARLTWDPSTRRLSASGGAATVVDAISRHLQRLPTHEIEATLEALRL